MPEGVNEEEERAYRAGRVDQKLATHDRHFAAINGSVAEAAAAMVEVQKAVARLIDTVTPLVQTIPTLERIARETSTSAETAKQVAAALAEKTEAERSTWDRYRNIAAWALGVVIASVTIANFVTRMFA